MTLTNYLLLYKLSVITFWSFSMNNHRRSKTLGGSKTRHSCLGGPGPLGALYIVHHVHQLATPLRIILCFLFFSKSKQVLLASSNCIVGRYILSHLLTEGARCSSVVRAFANGMMDRRIDPSWWTHWTIFVPASAPRLVWQRPWYVPSCLWDGAYKRTLTANRK